MTSSTVMDDVRAKTTRYWDRMGKLNLLMGTVTAADHKRSLDQAHRNREAEDAAVREWIWANGKGGEMSEEEMGDNINLGDIYESHYHGGGKQSPQQSSGSLAKTLAAAGLAAAGIGSGIAVPIAVWNLTKPSDAVSSGADTDTQYGLRIFKED